MRILLFFDLPTLTKKQLKEYRLFVKNIKKLGFCMYQESVYTKLCLNESIVEATLTQVKSNLPSGGLISCLTITEKQFASIENLLGEVKTDMIINDKKIIRL